MPSRSPSPAAPVRCLPAFAQWKRRLLLGLLLFGAPVSAHGGAQPGAVRVIDGDTFDYRGERIRIADIDAPELAASCAEEAQLAAAATRRLRSLLAQGPFELVTAGRRVDRYGRQLRIVVRNGRSIGDMLVAEGLARTWSGRREPWCT